MDFLRKELRSFKKRTRQGSSLVPFTFHRSKILPLWIVNLTYKGH